MAPAPPPPSVPFPLVADGFVIALEGAKVNASLGLTQVGGGGGDGVDTVVKLKHCAARTEHWAVIFAVPLAPCAPTVCRADVDRCTPTSFARSPAPWTAVCRPLPAQSLMPRSPTLATSCTTGRSTSTPVSQVFLQRPQREVLCKRLIAQRFIMTACRHCHKHPSVPGHSLGVSQWHPGHPGHSFKQFDGQQRLWQ